MATLAGAILESHRVARPAGGGWWAGASAGAVPDHVLLGGDAAPFALPLVAAAPPSERLMVWAGRDLPSAAHPGGEALKALLEHAGRAGARVARATHGACEPLYLAAAAAPGRLAVSAGLEEHSCGALGTLAVRVGALHAAAVASGLPLPCTATRTVAVVLTGEPPPGSGGVDLALDVARRLDPRVFATGVAVEVIGPGVREVSVPDRLSFARTLTGFGAGAVLFPSDERTRIFLRRCGRDPVWREIAAPDPAGYAARVEVDLAGAEPQIGWPGEPSRGCALRRLAGRRVARVVIGPLADEAEVAAVAAALGPLPVAAGTALEIVAGGSRAWDALERAGTLDVLRRAGATMIDPGASFDFAREAGAVGGEALWVGVPSAARPDGGGVLLADVRAAAAAARTGAITDPRESAAAGPVEADAPQAAPAGEWLPPLEPPAAEVALAPARRPEGPPRAIVRLAIGDAWQAARLLPRGARRAPEAVADPGAHAAPEIATAFAGRGPGALLAGREYGGGERAEESAWALARTGVVVVAALGYAAGAAAALARAGVLALVRPAGAASRLAAGDEMEFPALPQSLEPGRRVLARNLTRGVTLAFDHPWDGDEVAMWRAGGVLALAARTAGAG
jgi:aconitate hydratase